MEAKPNPDLVNAAIKEGTAAPAVIADAAAIPAPRAVTVPKNFK